MIATKSDFQIDGLEKQGITARMHNWVEIYRIREATREKDGTGDQPCREGSIVHFPQAHCILNF